MAKVGKIMQADAPVLKRNESGLRILVPVFSRC